jgi:outer membrane protein assembly factor BamA
VGARGREAAGLDREQAPCQPAQDATALRLEDRFDADEDRLRYVLERIEVRGNRRTRERVVLRYVQLHPGDVLDAADPELELFRYRLLGTGFFQTVDFWLRKGSKRGAVVLVIEVRERNSIVVGDLWMGLSADAETNGRARPLTAYAGADIAETNLGGTGVTLGGAMGLAQNQLALRVRFFDPAFLGTRWMTSAVLLYNDAREFYGNRDVRYDDPVNATEVLEDFAVVRYRRFGGTVGVGRDLSMPTQLWVDYRLERVDATLPLAASHERGLDTEPIEFGLDRGLSILSTVRATLRHDTRDSPFLPTRGWQASVAAEVSLAPFGSSYPYEKVTLNASRWFELPWRHVVRAGFFAGAISGYAPIYERFYVGDFSDFLPSRMLDLNTDRRPAPNFLGTDIVEIRFGDYAAKVLGEYRIPLYRGHRSVYGIDLFGTAGMYGVASHRDLTDPPRGYSGLARVPVDLTFNLGLQIDTNVGGFTFAFSNVLGFIPVRGEGE